MIAISLVLALILSCLGAPSPSPSQEHGAKWDGLRFGRSVLTLEDLDGDGQQEIAVGAPTAAGEVEQAGLILVLSGADRKVIQEWRGEPRLKHFGHNMRDAGDVNADGNHDVLVGYEFDARTEVRSGVDGTLLLAFDVSYEEVLPFGDANRDGAADFLLVRASTLEVRSGCDGSLLAGQPFIHAEGPVHSAGDLDGDGLADIVLAAEEPVLWRSGMDVNASWKDTRLFHPGKRTPLAELWPEELERPKLRIVNVAPAGDLNGDGVPDLIVATSWGEEGVVLGLSLAHPNPLFRVTGKHELGHVLSMAGDLDGDGVRDVLLGEDPNDSAFQVHLWAHSGANGDQLWHASWDDRGATSGLSLALLAPEIPGQAARILAGSSDWFWHGRVVRNGMLRSMAGATGEELWTLPIEDLDWPGTAWVRR